jgi:hypothetical protein
MGCSFCLSRHVIRRRVRGICQRGHGYRNPDNLMQVDRALR